MATAQAEPERKLSSVEKQLLGIIKTRLQELAPLVDEVQRLQDALDALNHLDKPRKRSKSS
jgi:hypothetical protein